MPDGQEPHRAVHAPHRRWIAHCRETLRDPVRLARYEAELEAFRNRMEEAARQAGEGAGAD